MRLFSEAPARPLFLFMVIRGEAVSAIRTHWSVFQFSIHSRGARCVGGHALKRAALSKIEPRFVSTLSAQEIWSPDSG